MKAKLGPDPITRAEVCPYCDGKTKLVDGLAIYPHRPDLKHKRFWKCLNGCDAYVGCHPNSDLALGRLANAELRKAKSYVHRVFDPIWREGSMSRGKAYRWLARELGLHIDRCHVGMFDVETCRRAYRVCKDRERSLAA